MSSRACLRSWWLAVPGHFSDIADYVIQMDRYCPVDITEKVKEICGQYQAPRIRAPYYQILEFNRMIRCP